MMRDRLIELIKQAEKEFGKTGKPVLDIEEYVSDHLINNGVIIRDRGEWMPITGYLYGWRCSGCNHAVYSAVNGYKYPFCPHCGADMRKEGEGNESNL